MKCHIKLTLALLPLFCINIQEMSGMYVAIVFCYI